MERTKPHQVLALGFQLNPRLPHHSGEVGILFDVIEVGRSVHRIAPSLSSADVRTVPQFTANRRSAAASSPGITGQRAA